MMAGPSEGRPPVTEFAGSPRNAACVICQFEVTPDDVTLGTPGGRCICLRCYLRESGQSTDMPSGLRKDLIAALAEIGGS